MICSGLLPHIRQQFVTLFAKFLRFWYDKVFERNLIWLSLSHIFSIKAFCRDQVNIDGQQVAKCGLCYSCCTRLWRITFSYWRAQGDFKQIFMSTLQLLHLWRNIYKAKLVGAVVMSIHCQFTAFRGEYCNPFFTNFYWYIYKTVIMKRSS